MYSYCDAYYINGIIKEKRWVKNMKEIKVYPTIASQVEGDNYLQKRTEAYLNLSYSEAHNIVEEAAYMLEAFLMNMDKTKLELNELSAVFTVLEDQEELIQAFKTLKKLKRIYGNNM